MMAGMPAANSATGHAQPVRELPPDAPAHQHIHKHVDDMAFGWRHLKVWAVSAAGLMLAGYSFFMVGVVLPLIEKDAAFPVTSFEVGAIASAGILGTLLGAVVFGSLVDRYGRKLIFRMDPLILSLFGTASALAPSATWLILFQVLFGLGIGGDYPIAEAYVSETMPKRVRSSMVAGVIACQAVGGMLAAAAGFILLHHDPEILEWRFLLASIVPIAAIVFFLRLGIPESPKWLAEQGRIEDARAAIVKLFGVGAKLTIPMSAPVASLPPVAWLDLFGRDMRRRTGLICLPWPCMDIAAYGIGIFTPIILLQVHFHGDVSGVANSFIAQRLGAIEGSVIIDAFLVVGFALGIALIGRTTRVGMQIAGFVSMFLGLLVVMLGAHFNNKVALIFSGFILFNTAMNAGPNLTTYTMPSEVIPIRLRASAAGLAAACGKLGATIGTLLFPLMLNELELIGTLAVVALLSLIGAIATYLLRAPPCRDTVQE
jgi:MFS family permease